MSTRISARVLRPTFLWILVAVSVIIGPTAQGARLGDSIVISEIMYHPYHPASGSEDLKQEWMELFNRGTQTVDLTGWRFSDGVEFVFPTVSIGAGKYLVVAADVSTFRAKHPGVANVVGGWIGGLSNSGEKLELADSTGTVVNTVRYADQGDWGVRSLGPVDLGHRGWEWSSAADGTGKSLELINASLPNDCGQNWAPSAVDGGTPGAANSVAAADIAPLIVDVLHWPMIPTSTEAVTVTARILDEQTTGLAVTLHYRLDNSTYTDQNTYPKFNAADYVAVPMADDGAHGDGRSGDGVYGATIPAQANAKIVEFYVEARDAGGKTRTWPAPSLIDGVPQQVTNALYQVDNSFSPTWTPGSQPVYYLIMTEMERGRLAYIGTHSTMQGPDSQMNVTFISVDGTGMEVRHNVGVRNRGHGTRNQQPNQYHVDIPHDRPWKGMIEMNLNTNYTYVEITACAVFQMAGIAQSDAHPVKVRVNGKDLSSASTLRTSGSYDYIEAVNSDWAKHHFPDDSDGNAYKCMRSDSPAQAADLRYLGTNPVSYQIAYSKTSNTGENDWSDLIELTRVLSDTTTSDSVYAEQVNRVLNAEQWLRFVAVNTLADNGESSLAIGVGDEYFMYRGVEDRRFVLIQHDLEAMFGLGDERAPSATHGIWQATSLASMNRFLKHPQFAPRYFWHLKNLIETTFSAQQFDPLVDKLLGDWVPAARIAAMKKFTADRSAYVLSVIPQKITVANPPALQGGYPRVAANAVSLTGLANAIDTRRVTVNGLPALWTAWQATWSVSNVPLLPGINRVVIQAFDAADREIDRSSIDIWSDNRPLVTKVGGSVGANEVWPTTGGPYRVTGNITVPAGRTLTIEPGTTIFLDADCGFIVHGRLVAKGTEYQRIRFTRVPGTATQWAGFQFPDTTADNIIAYADLEFGGSRAEWITTGNHNANAAGPAARLTVDHATFSGSDTQYFSIWDPQIVIRNSVFADLGNHYMCMAERMPADGWFLVEGNLFGHTHGDTDILHLNSVSAKGGPVAQILDNVFTGGGDDLVDDNETDTYIEGNLFMHANVGNTGRSASAAVTTGPGGGSASANNLDTQQLTIVRNIFYHNDYGILCKTGASALIYANVFLQNAGALLFDETARADSGPGRTAYVDNCIFWKSGPEVDGTATDNGTGTFVNRRNTQLVVNNSIVKSSFANLGTGNVDADPVFVDADRDVHVDANLPCFTTGFPGFAAGAYLLKGLIPDVHLRPESPARGAGANGVDMGAMIPPGASIAGEPLPVTWRTSATLTVGGPDLQAYKYRVNNGPWSTEVVRPEAGSSIVPKPLPPIALTSLQNGQSCKVSVIGKDSTGLWQSESSPTVSRTWGIDTSYKRLVINEVLAVNKSVVKHDNAFPDLVELYYDGPAPMSLSGMSLSNDPAQPAMFVFPSGVTMNPGTYLVLYADSGTSGTGLHLGFALNADGDAVYLYDKAGVLLDSVVFGQQVPDVSIGRIGPLGQWHLTVPTFGQANSVYPLGDSRTVKINEWLASSEVLLPSDFIELYNPDPSPIDLGGMYLTDNPATQAQKHALRPLSFVPAGGYVVFRADDSNDPGHVNFRLSADGEVLGLFDAQTQAIDRVIYGPQTTDFSEGRAPDGAARCVVLPLPTPGSANPEVAQATTTAVALVAEKADKRVLVPSAAISDDWKGGRAFNDASWALCSGAPGGVGFETSTGYQTLITLDTQAQMYGTGKNNSCYLRIPFTLDARTLSGIGQLMLKMRYDDGFVAYLNGKEVARRNFTGTPAWNSHADTTGTDSNPQDFDAYIDISSYKSELKIGANILAIQGMNVSNTSSDFLICAALDSVSVKVEGGSNIDKDLKLLDGLRVTELMYRAPKGSNYDYVELQNILEEPLDVNGVRFDKGITFTFPALTLQPRECVVVVANQSLFRSQYGATPKVAGQYQGNLSDSGEKIVLLLPSLDVAILRFEYSNTWYPATDGGGKSLTIQDPATAPVTWNDAESWRAADPTPGKP